MSHTNPVLTPEAPVQSTLKNSSATSQPSAHAAASAEALPTGLAHDGYFNALRHQEYARLDEADQVYLDYTGASLYGASQLNQHHQLLHQQVLGNPHSTNPSAQLASAWVAEAREKVLAFFNAKDYHCVFTANATGALKIVGESYPFQEGSHFLLLADNHNSVNGIREYCVQKGGRYTYVPMRQIDLKINDDTLRASLHLTKTPKGGHKLFAYPAQSNTSGVQHDLGWVAQAQKLGWDVLLDAAAFVPTNRLDLSAVQPNFVSISFYKMFGYPTGLGCLLIRKDSFAKLRKPWFAGGTVWWASVIDPRHHLAEDHERFEDGTIDYLNIPAVSMGLDYLSHVGIDRLHERVASLTNYLYQHLLALRHGNGETQVEIFGPKDRSRTGGTLMLNFKNPDGTRIHIERIEALANERNISIRSGCFCNPGLDEIKNHLTGEAIAASFTEENLSRYEHVNDLFNALKNVRGATRVSVGIATTRRDLDLFIEFAKGIGG